MLFQASAAAPSRQVLDFAEWDPAVLDLPSQSDMDAEWARSAVLPPLQSVLELTNAHVPLQRGGTAEEIMAGRVSAVSLNVP